MADDFSFRTRAERLADVLKHELLSIRQFDHEAGFVVIHPAQWSTGLCLLVKAACPI